MLYLYIVVWLMLCKSWLLPSKKSAIKGIKIAHTDNFLLEGSLVICQATCSWKKDTVWARSKPSIDKSMWIVCWNLRYQYSWRISLRSNLFLFFNELEWWNCFTICIYGSLARQNSPAIEVIRCICFTIFISFEAHSNSRIQPWHSFLRLLVFCVTIMELTQYFVFWIFGTYKITSFEILKSREQLYAFLSFNNRVFIFILFSLWFSVIIIFNILLVPSCSRRQKGDRLLFLSAQEYTTEKQFRSKVMRKIQWWVLLDQKSFLGCRSKCLVYTEGFCEQHAPNPLKIDIKLNQLWQLSFVAIQH